MDKKERKALKRGMGKYTWALLVYYLIFNMAVFAAMEFGLIYEGFQAVIRGGSWDDFAAGMMDGLERSVYGNGWGYLIACAAAVLCALGWKGRDFFKAMFHPKQDMKPGSFWALLCLMMGGQIAFQIIAVAMELLLNVFGMSLLEAMEASTVSVDTLSMFLYMAVAAPIVEEIIFRGVVMRGLEPYGKRFAIFASALLFGAFHGNPIQSPYAFLVGLVLGYAAMEHSIWWAMVLHMVNNLALGDMLPRVTEGWPGEMGLIVQWIIILVCTVCGIVILIRRHRDIGIYRWADPVKKGYIKAFLQAAPNVIFFILMAINAVSMLLL